LIHEDLRVSRGRELDPPTSYRLGGIKPCREVKHHHKLLKGGKQVQYRSWARVIIIKWANRRKISRKKDTSGFFLSAGGGGGKNEVG